jgi:hypothetical protein
MSQHPKYPLAGRARHQSRARNARFSVELNSPAPHAMWDGRPQRIAAKMANLDALDCNIEPSR